MNRSNTFVAGCRYRSWAELLRTLGIDAFACPNCQGRMRILALVREPDEVRRSQISRQ